MDDAEIDVSNKNEILSQSYSQGLERIGCKDDTTQDFELPAGLIRMREDQWEEFFKRYNKELEEDLEIDMTTDYEEEEDNLPEKNLPDEESDFELRQFDSDVDETEEESADEDGEEEEEEEEEDEEEEEEEEYFVKNKTPLRKTPSLIQYWIDTGRPPILMTEEPDEFSDLLGEDQSNKLITSMEVEGKRPSDSVFSSVDTAAYILSNINVTAKAETIAIVEGAKSLDLNDVNINDNDDPEVPGLDNQIDCDIRDKSPVKNNLSNKKQSPIKNINEITVNEEEILDKIIESPVKNNNFNNSNIINDNDNDMVMNPIAQCSPRIADVLPTHDDPTKAQVIESSNISKEYDDLKSRGSLKLNLENDNINCKTNTTNRKSIRRKLYSQRDSPVTIVPTTPISVNSNCNDSDNCSIGNINNINNYYSHENNILRKLHPAFATPSNKKNKVKRIKRASWARRMSRYKVQKVDVKSSDDEDQDNSLDKNKSINDKNIDFNKSNKSNKKKLIRPKKIGSPVRQSMRPKVAINYYENLSDEGKLPDENKEEKLLDVIMRNEALEAESKEVLESKEAENEKVEAFDSLAVCKKLTINLERLPVNYLHLITKHLTEVQNIEDSQESDVSTILMYECVGNIKDGNTDTETGTEISRQSEDDKSLQSGVQVEKQVNKSFVQRCLGSLSDKNLNETGLGGEINSKLINNYADTDTDSDAGLIVDDNVTTKSFDKSSMAKERAISFSSDEEDDFLKALSKNKFQLKVNARSDTSKNCDSLINDLTLESRAPVSSLLTVPTSVLRIVGNSDDENLISRNDLNIKKRAKRSIMTQKKSTGNKSTNRSLKLLDMSKEVESESEEVDDASIVNGTEGNVPLDSVDKADLRSNTPKNGVQDTNKLKKTSEGKNKLISNNNNNKISKKRLNNSEDSSGEVLESPPKKVKIVGKDESSIVSSKVNSKFDPSSNINLSSEIISNKSKNLDSSWNVKLKDNKMAASKEVPLVTSNKSVTPPGGNLRLQLKTPIDRIKTSNVDSNSVKKQVSFAALKLEKILMSDSNDSSDDSLFYSPKSANGSFNKIKSNLNIGNNKDNLKINLSSFDVEKSPRTRMTISTTGIKSCLNLTNERNFRRFLSDSDDSND